MPNYLPTLAEAPDVVAVPGSEERKRRARIAEAMLLEGSKYEPIQSWTQGAARIAQALVGGYQLGDLRRQELAEQIETQRRLQATPGSEGYGGTPAPAYAPPQRAAESESPAAPAVAPATRPAMDPRARGIAALSDPGVMAGRPDQNRFLDISTAVPTGYTLPPDRAKVASTARVVGDDEGVRLGYYDAPTTPGARPPNQPDAAALPGMAPAGATPVQTQSFRPPATDTIAQLATTAPPGAGTQRNPELNVRAWEEYAHRLLQWPPTAAQGQKIQAAILQYKLRDPKAVIASDMGTYISYRHPETGAEVARAPKDVQGEYGARGRGTLETAGAIKRAETTAEAEAKFEVATRQQQPQKQRAADIVVQDLDRGIATIDANPHLAVGFGSFLKGIPTTEANKLAGFLNTIKSNVGLDRLTELKTASGAGLGAVTKEEHALLQAAIGSLEQSHDAPTLRDNMLRVKNIYSNIMGADTRAGVNRELPTFQGGPGAPRQRSAEDIQALNWANSNPRDPRAAEIKRRLGVP